jgi:hypothetical protein
VQLRLDAGTIVVPSASVTVKEDDMFVRRIVLSAMCSALAFGCVAPPEPDDTKETIDNLIQAGFPADDIMVVDGLVYVGRDAEVSLAASREMLRTGDSSKEQYRTSNLVSASLAKICVNGSTFTGTLSQGLDRAIQNYDQQPLSFAMARTPSSGCNFTINAAIVPGSGGIAGFPSGGLPFGQINIGSGLAGFSVDTIEHVITHELGHTIGFRHSDFFNRSISCGGAPRNEESPPSGLGAILIPGTPSGATVGGSIMNSCFRTAETGEFTANDITALTTLYACNTAVWPDTAAMTSLNGQLYIVAEGSLWRASPVDGSWQLLGPGGGWPNTAAMTSLNGQLYIVEGGSLWRASPVDGSWQLLGPGGGWPNTAAMTSLNGQLYIVEGDSLWRASPVDGSWQLLGPGGAWPSTAGMTSVNGQLYIVQGDSLWRASPADGSWQLLGPEGGWADTAAVTSLSGQLYIVQADSLWRAAPADGSWQVLAPCAF